MPGRFFVHKSIEAFAEAIVKKYGSPQEKAFLFPSHAVAQRCSSFLYSQVSGLADHSVRIIDLFPNDGTAQSDDEPGRRDAKPMISAVIFPKAHSKIAKVFWQHSGDGISSRRAEYCHKAYEEGRLSEQRMSNGEVNGTGCVPPIKGPRRYQKKDSIDVSPNQPTVPINGLEGKDCVQFVEERFGRNLDVSLASNAKLAIRRRISGALTANVDLKEALETENSPTRTEHVEGFSENDVYLYPCGMSSIFNTHRSMLACSGQMKSISFG